MKPDSRFLKQPRHFWAHVRSISEEIGYTSRGNNAIKMPSPSEIKRAMTQLGLETSHLVDDQNQPLREGQALLDYFGYRAKALNEFVQPRLMNAEQAKALFDEMRSRHQPSDRDIPWNKQKGEKKTPAYLTALVNMIVRANASGMACDFDPRSLTTITSNGRPLRTLARRVDGAFPCVVNPIAIWEIKEYYYTTTFGSRVADGVYESLLDGMELEELREHEGIDIKHYLIVDAHYTWWKCGRSYLCRIIDMLHMGYIDEVLFGREVVDRLPELVQDWVKIALSRSGAR